MGKSHKMYNHVSDIADFDNYTYFGIKNFNPTWERRVLYFGLLCIMYYSVKLF